MFVKLICYHKKFNLKSTIYLYSYSKNNNNKLDSCKGYSEKRFHEITHVIIVLNLIKSTDRFCSHCIPIDIRTEENKIGMKIYVSVRFLLDAICTQNIPNNIKEYEVYPCTCNHQSFTTDK